MRLQYILFSLAIVAANAQNLKVQLNGNPIGAENTLNLIPGNGIMHACLDNPQQQRIDCTPSFNTSFIPTHDTVHANENYCKSTNGTIAYTCGMPNKALTSYRAGMTFVLNVDTDCRANCSVNIDNLGTTSIKKSDGATDPGGALKAGQPQWIFYDGKVFRLMGGAGDGSTSADQRGDVRARRVIAAMNTLPYQAIMNLDVTAGDLHRIRTAPGAGDAVLNSTTGGLAGQHMWIIISNDARSAKTISFGANFLSSGPLAGTVGKSATLHFVSDGTAWYEVSRTVGL
jgi:hypothetical protein